MFEEAQLFAPVRADAEERVTVDLPLDHPGFHDTDYRARRDELARLALEHRRGDPVPHADYTEEEHAVWRRVSRELAVLHARCAAREVLAAATEVGLPSDHIPQLDEVSALVQPITGFRYTPVAGIASLRDFYGSLGDGWFLSTQYIRHHSVPLYTPEPDVVHEVIGHATTLGSPVLAGLYRAAGTAAQRLETDAALQLLSRVFWFTLEFGVVWESSAAGRALKVYGAGLLSSYGEIQEVERADVRPLDLAAMTSVHYDITRYQPVLFAPDSMTHLTDVVGGFFDTVDDDAPARLATPAGAAGR